MATVTFDTLKFVERLRAAGVPEEQAKAEAQAFAEALAQVADQTLVTKRDVSSIEMKLVEHDGEFRLIKWMLGFVLAGVMALILKLYV